MSNIDDHMHLVRRFIEKGMEHAIEAEDQADDALQKVKWDRVTRQLATALTSTYDYEDLVTPEQRREKTSCM